MTWPLTPWIKGKPARVGCYLTRWEGQKVPSLRYFDGRRWVTDFVSQPVDDFEFAGLAFDPESAIPGARAVEHCPGGVDVHHGCGWWVPKP